MILLETENEKLTCNMTIFKESTQILYLENEGDTSNIFEKLLEFDKELEDYFGTECSQDMKVRLTNIIKLFNFPITVVYEPYYVDRVYRDEYYRYYSKKHFQISRNTKRLIFVYGKYSKEDFLSVDTKKHMMIESDLIGMVVLKPTQTLGRILLKPSKLNIPRCYVRTTKFELTIYGRVYSMSAFPFSGQDKEVMTCAEVNIWQIMEYFGSRYKDYKTLLPSELLDLVKESSDMRILPSDGLTVEQESFLFMKNGLAPIIYHKYQEHQEGDGYKISEQYKNDELGFLEILHFYIESGIPVLLNLRPQNKEDGDNHSITCIGHEYIETENLPSKMVSNTIEILEDGLDMSKKILYHKIDVLKSWSGYKKYVILEDHSAPYQVKELENLTFEDFCNEKCEPICWEVESFVVPLYKHVFMPAEDAYNISMHLIKASLEEICKVIGENSSENIPRMVVRIYLTTSKSYKDYKIRKGTSLSKEGLSEKLFYSQAAYPKFLWVCEYGTPDMYSAHRANGEFVLDATSSEKYSVISIRHGEMITYRAPEENVINAYKPTYLKLPKTFAMYESNNLKDSGNMK